MREHSLLRAILFTVAGASARELVAVPARQFEPENKYPRHRPNA